MTADVALLVAHLPRALGDLEDGAHHIERRDTSDQIVKTQGLHRLGLERIRKGLKTVCLACPEFGELNLDEEARYYANNPDALEDMIRGAGRLLELAKSAHAPAPKSFLVKDGAALATALLGVFERSEDRIAKSSRDFQADISAKVERISRVVDFVSARLPFPDRPLPGDDAISKARTRDSDPADLAVEALYRAAAVSPDRGTRDALLTQAQAVAKRKG